MKKRVEIWFPVIETFRDEIEIEIPDEFADDPQTYLDDYDFKLKLLENHPLSDWDVGSAFDVGYAGVRLVKDKKKCQN